MVRNYPFNGMPPPNLLLGYRYVAKIVENYLFDRRMFSNFTFTAEGVRRRWAVLTDCSYTVNVGEMSRLLSDGTDEFVQNSMNIQNAILMNRVVGSIRAANEEVRGLGLFNAIHAQGEGRTASIYKNRDFVVAYQLSKGGAKDLNIMELIWKLKNALLNYMVARRNRIRTNIPFDDPNWLSAFVRVYSPKQTLDAEKLEKLKLMDAVNIYLCGKRLLKGGALTLRSGTRVGLPMRLRPRRNGRAITNVVTRFIDSLPFNTRRRVRTRNSPEINQEEVSDREAEEDDLSRSGEYTDDDGGEEDEENIVLDTVHTLIQTLETELSPEARDTVFFEFLQAFYVAMQNAVSQNEATDAYILNWALYFFIMEHVASTLFYLNEKINEGIGLEGREYFGLVFAQVILRARDSDGSDVFSRVWYSASNVALQDLSRRITNDLVAVVNATELGPEMNAEEVDAFLQQPAFVDRSGDVGELLSQITQGISAADSIELSFRLKYNGLVLFARNAAVRLAAENDYEEHRLNLIQQRMNFARR